MFPRGGATHNFPRIMQHIAAQGDATHNFPGVIQHKVSIDISHVDLSNAIDGRDKVSIELSPVDL